MAIRLKFRTKIRQTKGLDNAPATYGKTMRNAMQALGRRLKRSAEIRMREDTKEGKRSLKIEADEKGVIVYSALIQAFIDAQGLKPGTFPSTKKGSRFRRWVERKMRKGELSPRAESERQVSSLTRRKKRVKKFKRKRRKIGRNNKGPLTKKQRQSVRDRRVNRMAFLLARSVFEHGIKASQWNQKALEANRNQIIRDLKNAVTRFVSRVKRGV